MLSIYFTQEKFYKKWFIVLLPKNEQVLKQDRINLGPVHQAFTREWSKIVPDSQTVYKGPDNSPDRRNYCSVCKKASCCWRWKPTNKLKYWGINLRNRLSHGHEVFMLRLGCFKNLLLHVHVGCWAWKAKGIQNGIYPAHLYETWTGPDPYLDLLSGAPTSYRVSGPHRTGSRRSRVNARPIWTQSGTGPKVIRSHVNGDFMTKIGDRNFGVPNSTKG